MIDVWLTCYHLDDGAYYWQQLGMFSLLMNMLSPCLQRILYIVTVILFDSSSSMTWFIHDYHVVTLLAEHTIDNNLACLVYWWTCCHVACRVYTILLHGRRPHMNFHVCVLHLINNIHTIVSSLENLLGISSLLKAGLHHGGYKSRSHYGSSKGSVKVLWEREKAKVGSKNK